MELVQNLFEDPTLIFGILAALAAMSYSFLSFNSNTDLKAAPIDKKPKSSKNAKKSAKNKKPAKKVSAAKPAQISNSKTQKLATLVEETVESVASNSVAPSVAASVAASVAPSVVAAEPTPVPSRRASTVDSLAAGDSQILNQKTENIPEPADEIPADHASADATQDFISIQSATKQIQSLISQIRPNQLPTVFNKLNLINNEDYKILKKENSVLSKKCSRIENESSKLASDNQNLNKNLKISQAELISLKSSNKMVEDRARNEVKKEIEKLNSEISQLKSDKSATAKHYSKLEKEMAVTNQKYESREYEIENSRKMAQFLTQQMNELSKQRIIDNSQLQELENLNRYKSQIVSLENELKSVRQVQVQQQQSNDEVVRLENLLGEKEALIGNLSGKIREMSDTQIKWRFIVKNWYSFQF